MHHIFYLLASDQTSRCTKINKNSGLDLMWRVVSHMRSCTFFEYTREILDVPGHTVQLNMLGGRLVLTDEPENVKAVMLTKVCYAKNKILKRNEVHRGQK